MAGPIAKSQSESFDADSLPLHSTNQLYLDNASKLLSKWIRRYEGLTGSPWENTAERNVRAVIGLGRLEGLNMEGKLSSAQELLFLWTARYMTHVERRVSSSNASSCDIHGEDVEGSKVSSMNSTSSEISFRSESHSDDRSATTGVSLATRQYEDWFQTTSNLKDSRSSPSSPSKHHRSQRPVSPDDSTGIMSSVSMNSIKRSDYIKALERGGFEAVNQLRAEHLRQQRLMSSAMRSSSSMKSGLSKQPFDSSANINGIDKGKSHKGSNGINSDKKLSSSVPEISFKNRPFTPDPKSVISDVSLQSIESSVYIEALEEGGIKAVNKLREELCYLNHAGKKTIHSSTLFSVDEMSVITEDNFMSYGIKKRYFGR